MSTDEAYRKVLISLKRRKNGATTADVCAATALPLSTVNELLPKAADEYSGHLKVTSSGEIVYYFPNGFINRYRSFGAVFKRAIGKAADAAKKVLAFLFKVWIMVMLVGYFVLFIAIALASIIIQIAGRSDSKRGGVSFGLFDILIRIWFYSEITRPRSGYMRNTNKSSRDKRPMHKAIFSFIFGEDDPNKNWEDIKNRAVISFLQANNGVISLAEYMAFSGESGIDAEKNMLSFCSKFEGTPEATEDGTIVYRFEKLLLRSDTNKFDKLIPPVKRLKIFSVNKKSQNGWFVAINAFNLIFGSYFLYQSVTLGHLTNMAQYQGAPAIYAYTHYFLQFIVQEPHNFIKIVLGLIPLLFSFFFWLIPVIRFFMLKNDNKKIKNSNFKRFGFSRILASPEKIEEGDLQPSADECKTENQNMAFDGVIKDIGAISSPEIEITDNGKQVYSFKELEREKQAIEKYRKSIDMSRLQLGETVFDSSD